MTELTERQKEAMSEIFSDMNAAVNIDFGIVPPLVKSIVAGRVRHVRVQWPVEPHSSWKEPKDMEAKGIVAAIQYLDAEFADQKEAYRRNRTALVRRLDELTAEGSGDAKES